MLSRCQRHMNSCIVECVGHATTKLRFRVKLISAGNTVSYFTSVGYQLYMAGITKKTGEANMFPKPFYDLQGWVPTQIACGNTCTAVVAGFSFVGVTFFDNPYF